MVSRLLLQALVPVISLVFLLEESLIRQKPVRQANKHTFSLSDNEQTFKMTTGANAANGYNVNRRYVPAAEKL